MHSCIPQTEQSLGCLESIGEWSSPVHLGPLPSWEVKGEMAGAFTEGLHGVRRGQGRQHPLKLMREVCLVEGEVDGTKAGKFW